MKSKNYLVLIFSLSILTVLSTSFINGPANRGHDKTGSPVSSGSCMNCHSSGSFSPSLLVALYDGETEVTTYEAGKQYTLRYQLLNSGSPAAFGFQTTALDANNENAGSFSDLPEGFQMITLKEVDYVEHSTPRPLSTFEVSWTAPESADDVVTIYTGGVAANANNNTGGDGGTTDALELQPNTASDLSDITMETEKLFELESNLVRNYIRLNTNNDLQNIRIYNMNGQILYEGSQISSFENETIPVAFLTEGMYIIQASSEGIYHTEKFYKS